MTTRIQIVDDHEVLREGLKSLLAKLRPDWIVCGEATDGDEAIRLAQELHPDVIIMDITMPRMSGLEACSRLRTAGMTLPVLVFTTHQSDQLPADVRRAGAQGYVLKSQAARDLVVAIDALLAGGTFFGAPPLSQPAKQEKSNPKTSFRLGFIFAS